MSEYGKIYIGSILLEKMRWNRKERPSVQVSNWAGRFNADGFDGMELWEYHVTDTDEGERGKLDGSECPIKIFNSYAAATDEDAERRAQNSELALRYSAEGMKFNVGGDASKRDEYLKNIMQWRDSLAGRVKLLCECHPGTIIETPSEAKKFFDVCGLEGIGIIVHSFNAVDTLADWFKHFGDKICHTHLQSRDSEGHMISFTDDEKSVTQAIDIFKSEGFTTNGGSFTMEFTDGTSTENDNPDYLYNAALKDFEYLKSLLA